MKFGTLKIKTSDGKLRDYPLDQPSISVGRAQGNELIVEDSSVSRRHARLSVESGHLMIEDLGSANGTFIGSQRVPPNAPSLVPEKQIVRVGDVEITYVAPPPIEATQAFVNKPTMANIAPAVAPDGPPVNLSLVGPTQPVAPGSVTTANLTLQNRGTVVDEMIIQIAGIPAEWFRLTKDRVPLLPNAQETITITFAPPRRSDAAAADHSFIITVTSREHRSRATAQGTLKVLPFQNFTLSLQPQRSRRDFQVAINNQGNAPAAYRFSGLDDEHGLNYRFGQEAVTLQPGQSGVIPLQVVPKIAPRVGARETRSFNVIASPLDPTAVESKASGQLIIRPPIPVWLIPLVLLLAALACVIGAIVYNQRCGTWGENLPFCSSHAKPTIDVFTVTPNEIEKGGAIALQWAVSNAEQVELTQPVQETLDKTGVKTYNIDQSTNFTLRATNFAGSTEKSITVKLKNTPPVIQSFKADPAAVTSGRTDKIALSWTVAGADAVSIEGVPGASGATGSAQVDPPQADKTYTLIAANAAGTITQPVTIRVTSAGCTIQGATEMREGPAKEYRVIDSLAAGTAVLPVGRNATGEWLRVQANREGWVNATAIQCTVAMLSFATISPAEIPPAPTSTPTATPPPTATPVPTAPPVPTLPPAMGGPWAGQWETTFGVMNVTQSGNSVVGTYNNGSTPGTINATVTGNHLKGTWTEGASTGSIDWWLGSSGKKWRGNFNAVSVWCGHRSGESDPAPCGVGTFDGAWMAVCQGCDGAMNIAQDGNKFTGTYVNGTVEGAIDGNTATGTWRIGGSSSGNFTWHLINGNQFNGNYGGLSYWCGYRSGSSAPASCLAP